jgi:hypothetical protein
LQAAPAWVWGTLYLAAAVLMLSVVIRHRVKVLSIVAHGVALALTLWWLLAFVFRYATDDGTTIVNVMSWSTYAYLLARSALLIGADVIKEELS